LQSTGRSKYLSRITTTGCRSGRALNSDGTGGCITVSGQNIPRCSWIYTSAKLKVGDRVHVWVEEVPAVDNPQPTYNPDISVEIFLMVAEPS
jgi:positive regulator of sigma E activity